MLFLFGLSQRIFYLGVCLRTHSVGNGCGEDAPSPGTNSVLVIFTSGKKTHGVPVVTGVLYSDMGAGWPGTLDHR